MLSNSQPVLAHSASVLLVLLLRQLMESCVWTSVFSDIGLAPLQTADGSARFEVGLRLCTSLVPHP